MQSTSLRLFNTRLHMKDHLSFRDGGLMRLGSIIAPHGPIPVSKSTWWAGVKTGRYPKPVRLGPRITAWRVEDIRSLIQTGSTE
jgi:prophage regulatory protein